MDRLRQMGYRLGQGFHLARPLPADEAGAYMRRETTPLGSARVSR